MFLVTSNEVASLPAPRNAQSTLSGRLSPGDSKRPPAGESRHPLRHWYENTRLPKRRAGPVIPAKAGIQRGRVAPTTPNHFQLPGLIFIPWCAGTSRHGRLVRKCALQSPSIPALRRRNVPNCRPMVDGGMRKCSAGACPPQGSGWGVAESVVPIRCTKPQLRLFILWCAGANRHERLVRKWCYAASSMPECHRPPLRHSGESRNPEGWGEGIVALALVPSQGHTATRPANPATHYIIAAPTSSFPPPLRHAHAGGNPRKASTAPMTLELFHQPALVSHK